MGTEFEFNQQEHQQYGLELLRQRARELGQAVTAVESALLTVAHYGVDELLADPNGFYAALNDLHLCQAGSQGMGGITEELSRIHNFAHRLTLALPSREELTHGPQVQA